MTTGRSYTGKPIRNKSAAGFTLFGELQEVQAAEEPSNIIWENLHNTNARLICSRALNFLLVAIVLVATLVGMAYLRMHVAIAAKRYPDATQCDDIAEVFEGRDLLFREYAERDKE